MTERWVKMVEKLIPHEEDCHAHNAAVKLLASQHRAMVDAVKNLKNREQAGMGPTNWVRGDYIEGIKDVLAALAKQGEKQ